MAVGLLPLTASSPSLTSAEHLDLGAPAPRSPSQRHGSYLGGRGGQARHAPLRRCLGNAGRCPIRALTSISAQNCPSKGAIPGQTAEQVPNWASLRICRSHIRDTLREASTARARWDTPRSSAPLRLMKRRGVLKFPLPFSPGRKPMRPIGTGWRALRHRSRRFLKLPGVNAT